MCMWKDIPTASSFAHAHQYGFRRPVRAAFLTLASLLILTRTRNSPSHWRYPLALGAAYASTLLANSLRLSATPWIKTASRACLAPPFHDAVHLLAGLFTYLSVFVLLAFLLTRRCSDEPTQVPPAS